MPTYSKADTEFIVERDDLSKMLDSTNDHREKFALITLWLTGARPSEIVELSKEDITIKDTVISYKMPIKKRRKGKFTVKDRILEFDRPLAPGKDKLIEFVAWYISKHQFGLVFDFTTRTLENIVLRASKRGLKRYLCPYNFRHGRMTLLGRDGASIDELMQFKGAADVRSISTYIHARPFKVKI